MSVIHCAGSPTDHEECCCCLTSLNLLVALLDSLHCRPTTKSTHNTNQSNNDLRNIHIWCEGKTLLVEHVSVCGSYKSHFEFCHKLTTGGAASHRIICFRLFRVETITCTDFRQPTRSLHAQLHNNLAQHEWTRLASTMPGAADATRVFVPGAIPVHHVPTKGHRLSFGRVTLRKRVHARLLLHATCISPNATVRIA